MSGMNVLLAASVLVMAGLAVVVFDQYRASPSIVAWVRNLRNR